MAMPRTFLVHVAVLGTVRRSREYNESVKSEPRTKFKPMGTMRVWVGYWTNSILQDRIVQYWVKIWWIYMLIACTGTPSSRFSNSKVSAPQQHIQGCNEALHTPHFLDNQYHENSMWSIHGEWPSHQMNGEQISWIIPGCVHWKRYNEVSFPSHRGILHDGGCHSSIEIWKREHRPECCDRLCHKKRNKTSVELTIWTCTKCCNIIWDLSKRVRRRNPGTCNYQASS